MIVQDTLHIRVRYHETDGQGRVHHAQYLNYFERGRVELLRSHGHSYRDFEAEGLMLVVVEMNIKYHGAAQFDDLLTLTTRVLRSRGVRIEHSYVITRGDSTDNVPSADNLRSDVEADLETIATATSTIACIDREGKVRPLPKYLRS